MTQEPTLDEFHTGLTIRFQQAFMNILQDPAQAAVGVKLGVGLNNITYTLGASIASILYEYIREEEQKGGLTQEQSELMEKYVEGFLQGYEERLNIIRDPIAFQRMAVDNTSH